MKWLEIIKLRLAGNDHRVLNDFLLSMNELSQRHLEIRIYRHAALESDLSLHLYWETERPERSGSGLGLHLVRAFKEFGLVDHTVWKKAGLIYNNSSLKGESDGKNNGPESVARLHCRPFGFGPLHDLQMALQQGKDIGIRPVSRVFRGLL